jgi:hypothetical protein
MPCGEQAIGKFNMQVGVIRQTSPEPKSSVKPLKHCPPPLCSAITLIIFLHHAQNIEEHLSKLQITLLDSCEEEESLKKLEDKWMCNLGTLLRAP